MGGFPQSLSSGGIRTSIFQEIAKAPRQRRGILRTGFRTPKTLFQQSLKVCPDFVPHFVSRQRRDVEGKDSVRGKGTPNQLLYLFLRGSIDIILRNEGQL